MKYTAIAAAVFAVSAALATTANAQTRHDEKPHGMTKSAPAKSEDTAVSGMAGRHDEKPHGMKKVAKKPTDKPAADKAQGAK